MHAFGLTGGFRISGSRFDLVRSSHEEEQRCRPWSKVQVVYARLDVNRSALRNVRTELPCARTFFREHERANVDPSVHFMFGPQNDLDIHAALKHGNGLRCFRAACTSAAAQDFDLVARERSRSRVEDEKE